MTKKTYMMPAMQVVKLQQQHIICTSSHGVNNSLQSTEVDCAWSRGGNDFDDEE